MPKQKLTRCEIRWDRPLEGWLCRERLTGGWVIVAASFDDEAKPTFAKRISTYLRARISEDGVFGFSLRIYKKNGEVQQERTYPRSADPRRSKG